MDETKTLYEKIYFEIVPMVTSQAKSLVECTSFFPPDDIYMVYEIFLDHEQTGYSVLCGYSSSKGLTIMFQKEVRMTDDFDLHWINKEIVFAIVRVGGKYFKSMNNLKS
jgi:hypothetical protein